MSLVMLGKELHRGLIETVTLRRLRRRPQERQKARQQEQKDQEDQ